MEESTPPPRDPWQFGDFVAPHSQDRELLVSSAQAPDGMGGEEWGEPPNTLHYTGQPFTAKSDPAQNITRAEPEKPLSCVGSELQGEF